MGIYHLRPESIKLWNAMNYAEIAVDPEVQKNGIGYTIQIENSWYDEVEARYKAKAKNDI